MKKKFVIVFIVFILIIIGIYFCLPWFEFRKDNKLYVFFKEEGYGEFEDNLCFNESVSYNEKRDISITDWENKKIFLGLYLITLEYEEGNLCDTEYVLEESYIENIILNAEVIENNNNIDLEKLVSSKSAIVGNKRYLGNNYDNEMYYILDGKYEVLYVFYVDDLLVIQVGFSDEGARYIAYK